MASMFRTTRGGGMFQSPDTQRQYEMANALRQQSMQGKQGFTAPGGYYVSPGIGAALEPIAQSFAANRIQGKADETRKRRMNELSEALRNQGGFVEQQPQGDMQMPGGTPPIMPQQQSQSPIDRLSALEDNPQAQNLAMALRMQQAQQEPTQPNWQKVEMNTPEGVQTGFVNTNSMDPTSTFRPMGQPQQEAPGKFVQDEQGNWVPNPAYLDFEKQVAQAGRTEVNQTVEGNEGPQVGTIPKGYQLIQSDNGSYRMEIIPGSPEEREMQEAKEQEAGRQEQKERYADVVLEDIDRTLDIVENSEVPVTGFGSYLAAVPGSPARDVAGMVDTIRANVGFDRLQQMRANSPTGGALGQVSELENRLLQATLGNIEQSQSEEQFKRNMRRMKKIYQGIVHGVEGEDGEVRQLRPQDVEGESMPQPAIDAGGAPGSNIQPSGPPEGVDPEDWSALTDEEKRRFMELSQ